MALSFSNLADLVKRRVESLPGGISASLGGTTQETNSNSPSTGLYSGATTQAIPDAPAGGLLS